ncbi:protoporphyrinogen oxidase [Pseudonocardia sp. KRD-184]|uniref:Coproporphyrinogen III oxidase n=1 Tax=Pseudonocardia oceani TaxID=2792013 RepID=A0ABS6UFT2_9PSEU|nr:protoporphyrinogen oxidase [Pseudonocardia oceani]MBW0090115.1 protoporphyrinogen oxidase [Pseudonocardia oceani]MBW0095481.1 protoporphyrinogen oxidase [Pseudonocardia oceani]MBW0109951.1 protoporphyrinogen oxidase [Pseudonocardia oceani]MBW0122155.1 protoporphyrinogen oxidase [Pseudonocardia oceani]MBW0131110.1 protoporphyrinogen oxidase [Pseudonocardia oceani]
MTGPVRVAVVGGGISGLAAAHRLRALLGPAARITVLERRDRVGGVLHTVDLAGRPFDVGAEAFLARRPEVPALLAELGLPPAVHPTAASATVRAGGRTAPLPGGTLLGVPTSAARLDALLSGRGLAGVAAEPGRPLDWEPGSDAALGGLLRERFGDEIADRLADPLLGGVYAGRVDSLGLRATIPALAAALDAGAPSLTAAADRASTPTGSASTAGAPGGPVFGAVPGGYRTLLDALAAAARADVRLGVTVRELVAHGGGWRLALGPTTDPEVLDVDAVVLAVPAPAAAKLLAGVAPAAARASGQIELASSVVVALAFREADAAALPPTSGTLVAADEPLHVKGVTHSGTKWAHLAGDGLVRLRASLGRFGEAPTLQVDDDELVARVRADLAVLTGITAAPVAAHVQRWGGGLPQYGVGHLDRITAIEGGLPAGLAVAGAALHGVGVPACVATARAAAGRIAAALSPS